MFNFLLGVADQRSNSQAVTKEQFTELENGIYERMKDVQDMAHTIQSDQISFLNNNITTLLTVAGIIIAIVGIFASVVLSKIKQADVDAAKKMTAAQELMDNASTMMKTAKDLGVQANEKINDLEKLLTSKKLEEKIKNLEAAAEVTSRLEKQVQATFNLQHAQRLVDSIRETYTDNRDYYNKDQLLLKKAYDAVSQCRKLDFQISQCAPEVNALVNYPNLHNSEQVLGEANNILRRASALQEESIDFYHEHILPAKEREWEKGD